MGIVEAVNTGDLAFAIAVLVVLAATFTLAIVLNHSKRDRPPPTGREL